MTDLVVELCLIISPDSHIFRNLTICSCLLFFVAIALVLSPDRRSSSPCIARSFLEPSALYQIDSLRRLSTHLQSFVIGFRSLDKLVKLVDKVDDLVLLQRRVIVARIVVSLCCFFHRRLTLSKITLVVLDPQHAHDRNVLTSRLAIRPPLAVLRCRSRFLSSVMALFSFSLSSSCFAFLALSALIWLSKLLSRSRSSSVVSARQLQIL